MGKSDIEEVNEVIGMNIPYSAEYDTFSGYVLEQIGRIPSESEEYSLGEFQVVVKAMDGNRIKEFIVRQIEKTQAELSLPSSD
jgi:CBS domain containing-hemolysin-like protein